MAFPVIALGIIALILGTNGRSSLTNYKQTTAESSLEKPIAPSSTGISTVNTGLHTHQVKKYDASNVSVASSSAARLPTKTVAMTAGSSSSTLSLPSMTTLRHTSVVINESSLQTTSQSITGRSVSDYQDRQTGTISIDISSAIIFGSTVSLKSASLISLMSHSSKSFLSQYTFRDSSTLVSRQEDRSSSEMHVTVVTTDGSGGGSKTQTVRHNFTNGMSLRTTITHGSLTKTILPSFHTKGSNESFFGTPMVGQSSTRRSLPASNGNATSFASNITSSTNTNNFSGMMSVILPTKGSVATFNTIGSSLPPASFTPTISYSVTKTSLISKMYKTADVLGTLKPTPYSSDKLLTASSEVHATRVSTTAIPSFQTITVKSISAEAKTSSKLSLSSNVSGSIVASISQTEKKIISGSPTVSMESPSRVIKDPASETSVKDASKTMSQPLSATINSPFSSTIKEPTVRINTSNTRSIGSNLDSSLDTFVSGSSISNIKSTMFQISSFVVSTYPFTPSLTAESLRFSVKASNTSTSLTASTAGRGSRLQSLTLAQVPFSTPFIVNPGVSETSLLVLTTKKPSKGVSVTMHNKSSTIAFIITVTSLSTSTNLSSAAEFPWTSDTKQQQTSSILIFGTSSHIIKPTELPFRSASTSTLPGNSIWTSFSKTKETLDSIQTPSSPSQETPLLVSKTTSYIDPDTIKTFVTATSALVATVSVSTQTGPLPLSPKQLDVSMVLQMTWESHYEYSYTPEFQVLASRVKTQVTKVLITLDGFLSLDVLRFWKSSVGVELVIFVKQGAEVGEDTVERTLIEANNTGVLDLPLTSIQVQQRETTTTTTLPSTQSPSEDKSIERWIIILIVAGILVLLMSLIICCLLIKLTNQRGGLRGRSKYQVSESNNYLSYLYTDCPHSESKPVILRMEERRSDHKVDSRATSAYGTMHSTSSREGSMSHKDDSIPATDYTNSDYESITNDPATSSTVLLSMEKRVKDLKADPMKIIQDTSAGIGSIQRLSQKKVQAKISTDENSVHQNHGFKDEETISQRK